MMESFFEVIFFPITDWRIGVILLIIGLYFYLSKNFGYFTSIGLKNPKPYPIIGTSYIYFTKYGVTKDMVEYIEKYGKVFGMFAGSTPELVVADEQLVREVLTTNFEARMAWKWGNKYLDRMLIFLDGNEWRRVRKLLTPAFSTGRLKLMVSNINKCCMELVQVLKSRTEGIQEMDVTIISGNFTMDVIASTFFGLVTDSQRNPNNQFMKYGKMVASPFCWYNITHIIMFIYPKSLGLFAKLGLTIVPASSMNFFCEMFDKLLHSREHQIDQRNDFMALMVKSYKSNKENEKTSNVQFKEGLNKCDIISSGFLFLLAGYETLKSSLSACLYHMADNIAWQEKVYEEIRSVLSIDGEELSYEHLMKMHLLGMCIEESLRLSPTDPVIPRIATKDCYLNDIFIKKGTQIWIPIYAIHHHPDFFEDPEKFNPHRFSAEAKASRSSFSFLAFGGGPRECIAKRMSLMETKMALVHLIRSFKFSLSNDGGEKFHINPTGVEKALITVQLRN